MQHILIDSARKKNALKRGGGWVRIDININDLGSELPHDEIEQVRELVEQLEAADPESAAVVKLRFFTGLTQQQCAAVLGISKRTADNRWAFARAWLSRAISRDAHQE
jgi:RNA polymerase sigma factor (TIGR02999 family)